MSAALPKLPMRHMTIPEFLAWADQTPGRWQLRDGEPELMAPAADRHGRIQAELTILIGVDLRQIGSSCSVVSNPGVVPRVRSDRNMLVPDMGITCAPASSKVGMPEPVVLFEILSPSNESSTRANIWAFTTIPSVNEIVVVSSTAIGAEVLRRRADGSWPELPDQIGPDDVLRLDSFGFATVLRTAYRTANLEW